EAFRMRRGESDTFEAGHVVDGGEEIDERGLTGIFPAVACDDLPEQRDFFDSGIHESLDFVHDFRDRPAAFAAARVGHDAERAIHVAALHDADERGDTGPCMIFDGGFAAWLFIHVHERSYTARIHHQR